MKEIDGQLYGYSYELNEAVGVDNGTSCYAVDTGTVFIAYGGLWYEQPGVFWCSGGAGDSDLYGHSAKLPSAAALDDLTALNLVDTGVRCIAFNGVWYPQPTPWSAAPSGSGGGGSGVFWVTFTWDEEKAAWAADKTVEEIFALVNAGQIGFGRNNAMVLSLSSSGEQHAVFVASSFEESEGLSSQFKIAQDGTVTFTEWAWTVEED